MKPRSSLVELEVVPRAEMKCGMMADFGGMQASISYALSTDLVKLASTSAIVTTDPLNCSDQHRPRTNGESVHHDTPLSVALNVRKTESAQKLYHSGMVNCTVSNSDMIMNRASDLNGHAPPEVSNGHAFASSANASIAHNALPTYKYSTGVCL